MPIQPMQSLQTAPIGPCEKDRSWLGRLWRDLMAYLYPTPQKDRLCASPLDVQMMQEALSLAQAAWDVEEVPVGAVIYRGDEIIASAHNLRESRRDPTAHAEVLAMRLASEKLGDWRLNDCSMAVTLEPCPMCAGAIVNGRIGRLIYGATDNNGGAVDSLYEICSDRRLNHRPEIIRGVLGPECRGILRAFFKERRKLNKIARQAAKKVSA